MAGHRAPKSVRGGKCEVAGAIEKGIGRVLVLLTRLSTHTADPHPHDAPEKACSGPADVEKRRPRGLAICFCLCLGFFRQVT